MTLNGVITSDARYLCAELVLSATWNACILACFVFTACFIFHSPSPIVGLYVFFSPTSCTWLDFVIETGPTWNDLRRAAARTKKNSISWSWSANVNVILQLSICICKEKPSRENMKSKTQSQPMTDDRPTFHETLSLSPWRGPTFKRRLKSCFSKHPCSSLLGLFAVFYAHCHPSADSLKHFSFASRSLTLYLTVFCVCFPCVVIILWTLR